jgi:hypothetical protein
MGSPETFKHLWKDDTFSKERTILTYRPFSIENYLKLKALETIIIQEAWKKYGKQTPQFVLGCDDIGQAFVKAATSFGVDIICLNMTDSRPRKGQIGYDIFQEERARLITQRKITCSDSLKKKIIQKQKRLIRCKQAPQTVHTFDEISYQAPPPNSAEAARAAGLREGQARSAANKVSQNARQSRRGKILYADMTDTQKRDQGRKQVTAFSKKGKHNKFDPIKLEQSRRRIDKELQFIQSSPSKP